MFERVRGADRGAPFAWRVACVLAGSVAGLASRGWDGIVIVMCAADTTVARSAASMAVGRNMVLRNEDK